MLERNPDAAAAPAKGSPSIAFGLERIGLIAVRAPILSCIILLAMVIGAVFGIQRIKIDDSLSQLFRSDTKEYRQYEEVTKRFPSTEFDVLVVVEGKTLLERDNLEKLRDLVTDLQLVDGVRGLISLFSARQAPEPGKLPAALFPSELPRRRRLRQVHRDREIQRDHSRQAVVRGRHARAGRAVAGAVDRRRQQAEQRPSAQIRKVMDDDLAGTGLTKELSGVPVMQLEIRNAVERDGIIYNVAGILAGCLIAILFFRKRILHDHRGLPAAACDPVGIGRAGLGRFQPQHVPQRDDAADHGHQLLRIRCS